MERFSVKYYKRDSVIFDRSVYDIDMQAQVVQHLFSDSVQTFAFLDYYIIPYHFKKSVDFHFTDIFKKVHIRDQQRKNLTLKNFESHNKYVKLILWNKERASRSCNRKKRIK